jgi:phosphate/sulfate permease
LASYTIGPLLGGVLAALMLLLTQKITPEKIDVSEDILMTGNSPTHKKGLNNEYTI